MNIGTVVAIENVESGEKNVYTILGPWDSDFEKQILSYRSPIAQALMGRKAGEEVTMKFAGESRTYRIQSIELCNG